MEEGLLAYIGQNNAGNTESRFRSTVLGGTMKPGIMVGLIKFPFKGLAKRLIVGVRVDVMLGYVVLGCYSRWCHLFLAR